MTVDEARGPQAPPVTTHPYFGIVGVLLGALTATLHGRLISVGLPDVRGALGLAVDQAVWLPTAFQMGTICLGVFSVFLGAAYGVRRVLLVSGVLYTLFTLLAPLAGSWAGLLALTALAGLASGSFYSLTLTFVARNLPPKLLIFGVAAYALDVVATSHLAALLQGWYAEALSWHWIYWTSTVLTPVMLVCLYRGVPPAVSTQRLNWRGFLYMSLGLSCLYAALDQGERLEWLQSGTIAGLLAAAALLMGASLARRLRQPNPLVHLPFLSARNVVILALGIFCIRFGLLAGLLAIPAFLGNIQHYRALETGSALAWVAAPQFLLVWIAAITTVFVSPRFVMASGFALMAVACAMAAEVDPSWAGESFFQAELLLSAGIAAAFVGLVVSLMMLALETGAVSNVANITTFSGSLHAMRLVGGQAGTVLLVHYLTTQTQTHAALLRQHVGTGDWLAAERLGGLGAALAPAGAGEAASRAVVLLAGQLRAQAYTMAVSDAFRLIAWTLAGYLVLLVFLKRSTISLRQAGQVS